MEDGIWQYRFADEAVTYAELSGFVVTAIDHDLIASRPDMAPGQEFYLEDQTFNDQERFVWLRRLPLQNQKSKKSVHGKAESPIIPISLWFRENY